MGFLKSALPFGGVGLAARLLDKDKERVVQPGASLLTAGSPDPDRNRSLLNRKHVY
jgi:hypothetical protein